MIQKELKDISWLVDEPTYRADTALSYSTLAKYEREGYDKLDSLFDSISTPSLTEGSAVDAIITGGEDEFNSHFAVLDINITDGGKDVCNHLFENYPTYASFSDIPHDIVSQAAKEAGFWKADKWDKKRYEAVLGTGDVEEYYHSLLCSDKTVIDMKTYEKVIDMVRALRESPSTARYFSDDDLFSSIRRYYQLKFKATLEGVEYRCMADCIIVDYEHKTIYPIDLKTSGSPEWNFEHSFIKWLYLIQSRLYWRIIRANLDNNPYFKGFTLENYRFIVVNKNSLTPLVWEFPYTQYYGTLVDDKGNEYRDPFEIGKELREYLDCKPPVPNGIVQVGLNQISCLHPKQSV